MTKMIRSFKPGLLILAAVWCLTGAVCGKQGPQKGPDLGLAGDEARDLAQADQALAAGKNDDAIRGYEAFLLKYPESPAAPRAVEKLGEAYYQKKQYAKADELWRRVLDQYPQSAEAVDAAWGLALLAYGRSDYAAAGQLIGEYRAQASGRRWEQMTLLLAECAVARGQVPEALSLLSEEWEKGSDQELRNQARTRAETLIRGLKDDQLSDLVRYFKHGFPGDCALLELANRAITAGDYSRAADLIAQFSANYPQSPYQADADRIKTLIAQKNQVRLNRIGVLLPQGGQLAGFGEQVLRGIMLAGNVLAPERSTFPVEFIVRDERSDQVPIEKTVEDLVKQENVIAIVGPLQRTQAERAAVKAEELGVPLIALSPGDTLARKGKNVYQNYFTKTEQVEAVVAYAVTEEKLSRFGVLYPNSGSGKEFMQVFSAAVGARGKTVVAVQAYAPNQSDFKNEIKALKDQKIQGLYIPDSSWTRVALIAPQLRFYSMGNVKLLGVSGWHDDQLLTRTSPQDLEGAVFVEPLAPEAPRPEFAEFSRRFQEQFGTVPGFMEATANETAALLIQLLKTRQPQSRDELRTLLDRVKDFPGVLGPITVDQYGKFQKPVYLYLINNGRFTLVSAPA